MRLHRDARSKAPAADTSPSSAEAALARGHAWLRFPAPLEAEFNADNLASRRKLLAACGVIGCLGVLIGSANVNNLTPEIGPLVWRIVRLWLAAATVGLGVVWYLPSRWQRNWHAEAITTVMAMGIDAVVIWMATASRADTAFTHSATAAIPVMYACIAARQRFFWALGSAVLSFGGYVLFVKGFTPAQSLIVASNIKLMAVSYLFVLVANYAFEHRERRNWLLRKKAQQQRAVLLDTSRRLQDLSIRDPLTSLYNRRQFDTDLARTWHQAATQRQALSLLMIDVDFFKRYNDSHGHPAGDACLARISQIMADLAQGHGGIAARWGGEEFALLLPGLAWPQAQQVGIALCEAVVAAGIPHQASSIAACVTVSVGLAQAWPTGTGQPQSLVLRADEALYQAKEQGRNQLCVAQPGLPLNEAPPALPLAPAPDANAASSEPEAPESAHAQTLKDGFRWLRFPADQEAAYLQHNTTTRRWQLAAMSVVGLVLYNCYGFSARGLFPDVPPDVLNMQLWVSALIMALAALAYTMPLSPLMREGVHSLGTAIVGVVSAWIVSHSTTLSALSYAVSLVLIPMFSGVGARQPFWFTCIPAIITSLAAPLLLKPVGPQQTMVFTDSLFMIINNTVYTLILAYTLEYGARKAWLLAQVDSLQHEALVSATARLQALSMQDPLTGICNRRQFEDDLHRNWVDSLRNPRPLAMLIIDIDHFKRYNDGYGHPAGDRCLRQVATVIARAAHEAGGLTARLGGEEFGILLPGGNIHHAVRLGEQVCDAIRQARIPHRHAPGATQLTVSAGAASLVPTEQRDQVALLAMADEALYQAKRAGRDRVMALTPHQASPRPYRNPTHRPGDAPLDDARKVV